MTEGTAALPDRLLPAHKAAWVPVAAQGRDKRAAAAQQAEDAAAAPGAAAAGLSRPRRRLHYRCWRLGSWRHGTRRRTGAARRSRRGRCCASAQGPCGRWPLLLLLLLPEQLLLVALLHVQLLLQGKGQRLVLAELAAHVLLRVLRVLHVLRHSRHLLPLPLPCARHLGRPSIGLLLVRRRAIGVWRWVRGARCIIGCPRRLRGLPEMPLEPPPQLLAAAADALHSISRRHPQAVHQPA